MNYAGLDILIPENDIRMTVLIAENDPKAIQSSRAWLKPVIKDSFLMESFRSNSFEVLTTSCPCNPSTPPLFLQVHNLMATPLKRLRCSCWDSETPPLSTYPREETLAHVHTEAHPQMLTAALFVITKVRNKYQSIRE